MIAENDVRGHILDLLSARRDRERDLGYRLFRPTFRLLRNSKVVAATAAVSGAMAIAQGVSHRPIFGPLECQ